MEIQNIFTHQEEQEFYKFSEQWLIDCNPYGYSCLGGDGQPIARDWMIIKEKHLVLDENYPYV
jgi:hypothetical protein